ncbi:MAG: MATE family efflux transporter [Lachnospiraceae bacterium]|nr:MATE family efflux transporter [Lachnospiraceae bacterium]
MEQKKPDNQKNQNNRNTQADMSGQNTRNSQINPNNQTGAASRNNKMESTPMPSLVFNMSLPLMISLLVQSLYNIVDSIFVARISEDALTAVSLAYPIQLLMIAVSVGTAVGVNSLLSRSLGAKQYDMTGKVATTGLALSLIGTAVFMILGLTCTGLFVRMFTDDAAIGEYCQQYLFICMVGCLGIFLGTIYQRFLQAVGNTFDSMISLVSGAVTNLILDPLLIFGLLFFPKMGIQGAAIATVIGQWVSGAVGILLNRLHNPAVQVHFKGFRFEKSLLAKIYTVGLPTIITQALGSLMLSAVNAILIDFSSTAVAFFGAYYKLQTFLFMPMNGMGQAAIPIAGYSFGAGLKDRVLSLIRVMVPAAVVISAVISAVFFAFPGQLLSLFSASEEMLALGRPALRIIAWTFPFASVTMILGYTMSGLGNGVVNMLGTALRQFILLVPGIWLLSGQFGVDYAWYAFWISELCAMAYAIWASVRHMKKTEIL